MKRYSVVALCLAVVVVLAGCGKPPNTQIQQATAALQAAQDAGAPKYAPDAWARAQQAMDKLKSEIAAQAKKFSLFRNYGAARTLADAALRTADQAKADALTRKKLAQDADTAVAELGKFLQTARGRLASVTRARGLDVNAMKALLAGAGQQLDKARTELGAGRFDSALSAASQGREAVTKVLAAIEKATGRPASKKR
jgi:hypothetical protein